MLRAQVVHGDLNLDNVLLDDRGRISAIVDFGDVGFSAQVADFAVGLASLVRGRPNDDVFRAARLAIDGYQSRIPLEPLELELLGDLVAARLAAIVTISAWRVERYPENAAYIQAWDDDSWKLLEQFEALRIRQGRGRARSAAAGGADQPISQAPRSGAWPGAHRPYLRPAGARSPGRRRLAVHRRRKETARPPTTTSPSSAIATRASPRRSSAKRGCSTPTRATCTSR